MSRDQYILIKQLIEDPSFIAWARGSGGDSAYHWDQWIKENPEKEDLAYRAKLIVTGVQFNQKDIDQTKVEHELAKLDSRIREKEKQHKNVTKLKIWPHWTIAASLGILILAGILGGYNMYWNFEKVYRTDFGERKEITLSDGTEVAMNANSMLKFVRKNPRRVQMAGEVFFNVQKKPQTGEKFTVRTADLDIEVLGTVFNVNTRSEKTEVMLEEGSVQLHMQEQKSIMMSPGDLISYSGKTKNLVRQDKVKTDVITSWKDGILIFDNTPLREALKLLEDTYNIKVRYENKSAAEKLLVGGIPNDNLELSLKTLGNIYDLEIEKIEDTVIIR